MFRKFFTIAAVFSIFFVQIAQAQTSSLSNELKKWYYNPNSQNAPPTAQEQINLEQFDAYYLGNTEKKEIYLTFDEGYENGFTAKILDVLKEKNVPAAFFVTKTYIDYNPDLVQRMVNEGHIVANHTVRHKSSPTLSDDEMKKEINDTAAAFKTLMNAEMPPFFRPPMGQYSERTLKVTQDCGYKSIFWSFAYVDWDVKKQPGAEFAHKKVMDNIHNGAILLLHAVSESNAQAMAQIIESVRAAGYEFKSLNELPQKAKALGNFYE